MSRASYARELEWVYGLEARGMRFGLERMEEACALRGHPERAACIVHVAGTNGKGSVCAMVDAMLRAAGLRTGRYTSPHLHRYVERVRIDGRTISEPDLARRLRSLREDARLPPLSFFEVGTLLAFEAFRDARPDVVIHEVGLGGRLDATNVVSPTVTAITNIGLEHTDWLGPTIADVAREKAGIAKAGVPLVVGERGDEARAVILARAREVGAPVCLAGEELDAARGVRGWTLRTGARVLDGVRLGLDGAHQGANAACALAILDALGDASGIAVSDDHARRGLRSVRWPGRLERIRRAPELLLDGAHNPDGCARLAEYLRERNRPAGRRVLVFGALEGKDARGMLETFDDLFDERVYALPAMRRAGDLAELAAIRPGLVAKDIGDALKRADRLAGPDGHVVVAGSIFLVAAVRALVRGLRADPPIAM